MSNPQPLAMSFSSKFEALAPLDGSLRMDDCEAVHDARSAVIHDDANLTIMFDGDDFTGSLIARNGMRTSDLTPILEQYNLEMTDIAITDLPFVTLFLRERPAAEATGEGDQ